VSGEPERRHSTDDDNIHGARGRGKINPSYPVSFRPRPPSSLPASFSSLLTLLPSPYTTYTESVSASSSSRSSSSTCITGR